MKPIFLLDVDGVLNAVRGRNSLTESNVPQDSWPDWQYEVVSGFPILIATGLINFVNTVHRSGAAEIRWLTTWEEQAQTDLAPAFGFDHFEVQPRAFQKFSDYSWWKARSAWEALAEGRPVVWTDDDLDSWNFPDIAEYDEGEFLPITPITQNGLTPDDAFAITMWLEAQKYGESQTGVRS